MTESPSSQHDDTAVHAQLKAHQLERAELLQRAQAALQQDNRVSAAWLFGSLGRGDADDLSDIDLFIIVADQHQADMVANRYAYMAQLGEPLLVLEAPQNWPPGAVYNMALYPGASGPHQIDWYWQRQSAARLPTEIHLLFDHVNLPYANGPTRFDYAPVPPRPPTEVATQEVNSFWVMLLIAAKYIARTTGKARIDMLQWPLGALRAVAQFVDQPEPLMPATELSPADPLAKLNVLRTYAAVMETLMPQAVSHGGRVPVAIGPQADRYLALLEAIVQLQPNPIERP